MTETYLRDYYASWASGDPDRVAAFFAESATFEDLAFEAVFEGPEGVREFARLTYGGVPDFRVTPLRIIIDGASAAAAWEMTGTHSGDLPGLPATGKPFRVRASSIVQVERTGIIEMVDYWNPVQFQRQVGLA